MFESEVRYIGQVQLPEFTGTRWMMMPVRLEDARTVPESHRPLFQQLLHRSTVRAGVGYLTVDEVELTEGEVQRRPGLHVDGKGGWGDGGGGWSAKGMFIVSSDGACAGYHQTFEGEPDDDGSCEHLRDQCGEPIRMKPRGLYWCSSFAVHEGLPSKAGPRTFVRLSMPSAAPWYEGYTESPFGVQPGGPVLPRRPQMDYRS
jgi:hypothetical protein